MTPACAGLLKLRGLGVKLLKSTFNAKNSMCRLSWFISPAILSQFTVEMCASAKNCEKFTITPLFLGGGVQSRSRSSLLTNLKSLFMQQVCTYICNRFYTIRGNTGKITSF